MKIIKLLDTGYDSFEYERQLFEQHGFVFEIFNGLKSDVDGKRDFASDADGLLIRWTQIDESFLNSMKKLRAIVRYGVGFDNINLEDVTKAGVWVANVQGYGNHAVSDHALALIYACNRHLIDGQRNVKALFGAPPDKSILEFHECTLGLIGLGRIGGALCEKAVGLFGTVLATDPYIADHRFVDLGADKVDLEELLQRSHVISVHCNLTQETEGLIQEKSIALMEKKPILINTARGPITDQEAVLKGLEIGKIRSAGIDVYDTELASELPEAILNHPKIIATGHYAWYSRRSHIELQKRAADNLLALLQGQVPADCLNPELGIK
jgi:D-3-phosphoglycerate dehydrogenase